MKRFGYGVCLSMAAVGLLGACGGSTVIEPSSGGAGGDGGTGGTGAVAGTGGTPVGPTACDLGTVGAQPPGPAPNADAPVSGKVALVVSQLLVGDRGWNGDFSPNAWKPLGYNLDGRISTRESTDLCQPAAGAPPSKTYPDGDQGIDNSFGKNLLPIFMGLEPDMAEELNAQIAQGAITMLFEVAGLGPGAAYRDLYGSSWLGAELPAPPMFNGGDVWPPLGGTEGTLSCGYSTDYTVVLTAGTRVVVPFSFGDYPWLLELRRPIITMDLEPDHQTVRQGIIAGVIPADELIEGLRQIAGHIDPGLCAGSTFDSIADQFRQAADLMSDGGQNPAATCDAISVGFGFRGTLVALDTPAPPPIPPPDPCL